MQWRHGRCGMSDAQGGSAPARPRQVTIAGVSAGGACLLLVVSLFDAMSRVRSAQVREDVTDFLGKQGAGLDLTVAEVIDLLRTMVLLSGALAAAGAVLAGYALLRHRGARVGLSVVAVLMLLTVMVTRYLAASATFVSGLLPLVVAVGTAMLWGRESRDWFAGRTPQPAPAPRPDARSSNHPSDSPSGTPSDSPSRTPSGAPGDDPFGSPAGQVPPPSPYRFGAPRDQQPLTGGPPQHGPARYVAAPHGTGRPVGVSVAAWLTWVFSTLTLLFCGLLALTLLAQRSALLEAMQRNPQVAEQGYSSQQILTSLWVFTAVGMLWSLAAIALAVLAFRRVRFGQVGLAFSAVVAALVGILTLVGVVHAVAALTSAVLLFRGGANQWYSSSTATPVPGDLGPPPSQPPNQPPTGPPGKPPVW